MTELVSYSVEQDVSTIRLERPDKLNAMTLSMWDAVTTGIEQAQTDNSRAIILTGTGDAFCAGDDIGALADIENEQDVRELTDALLTCWEAIESSLFRLSVGQTVPPTVVDSSCCLPPMSPLFRRMQPFSSLRRESVRTRFTQQSDSHGLLAANGRWTWLSSAVNSAVLKPKSGGCSRVRCLSPNSMRRLPHSSMRSE